ncbi:hypothetical protein Aperf_G00000108845 [Anoplocephala perfoliata]
MDVQSEEVAMDDSTGIVHPRSSDSQPLRRSNRGRGRTDQSATEGGSSASEQPIKKCTFSDIEYSINDYIYYEVSSASYYSIGYIEGINDRDKDKVRLSVRCYVRTFDIPDDCKDILDRKFRTNFLSASVMSSILIREIFSADALVDIDLNQLRGKCYVKSFTRLSDALHNFDPTEEDVFFNTYCYKAESQHLIPASPHVKIGADYQVTDFPAYRGPHPRKQICPKHRATSTHLREKHISVPEGTDKPPSLGSKRRHGGCRVTGSPNENCHCGEPRKRWEEMIWDPHSLGLDQPLDPDEYSAVQGNIDRYLAAARSIVAFAAIGGAASDSEAAQNGKAFAESMATTQHALDTLHKCDYDIGRAIMQIQVNPVAAKNTPMHWSTEQVKQFISGIRHCGRNFHEIQKRYFSATTGIDPFGSRHPQQSTYLRSARGRKRRRGNPVEPSGNVESISQQEEPEAGMEESIGEPADEEALDSPSLAELEGRYLFVPTVEKTTKELIEFFYFWKKKNAQQHLSFAGVKATSATAANEDRGQKVSSKTEAKRGKRAEIGSETSAADEDNSKDDGSGAGDAPPNAFEVSHFGKISLRLTYSFPTGAVSSRLTCPSDAGLSDQLNIFDLLQPNTHDHGQNVAAESAGTPGNGTFTCKFCSDSVVDSELPKVSSGLAQIPQIKQACAKCRLYYFKYGYMPGRARDRLAYPIDSVKLDVEDNTAIASDDNQKNDEQEPGCRCCVSPTYASCLYSPAHSFQGDDLNDEPLEIVEVEEQQKAAPQQLQVASQPETITIDGGNEDESAVTESSTHHKYSHLANHGTPAPASDGGSIRTDVKIQRVEASPSAAPFFNNMDQKCKEELQQSLFESVRKGSSLVEQSQTTFGLRQFPPNIELLKNVMHQMDPDPQPLNLRASTTSRLPVTSANGTSGSSASTTTTTQAKGTFYPPTGVPPPSGSSASSTNRGQHQSSRGSGRSSAAVLSSMSSASSRTSCVPPLVNPIPVGRTRLPESISTPANVSHFLRDQQTASYRVRPGNVPQIQQQQEQQFSELPGFTDQDMQVYLDQIKLYFLLSHQQQVQQQQQQQRQQQKQIRDQGTYLSRESAEILRAQQAMITQSENTNSIPDQTIPMHIQQRYLESFLSPRHPSAQSSRNPLPQPQTAVPFYISQSLQSPHASRELYNHQPQQQQQQQNLRVAASSDSFQQGAPVFYPQLPQPPPQQQQQAHQAPASVMPNSFAETVRLLQHANIAPFLPEEAPRQPGIAHQHSNHPVQTGQWDYRRLAELLSGHPPISEQENLTFKLFFAVMAQQQQMRSQPNQGPYGSNQQ